VTADAIINCWRHTGTLTPAKSSQAKEGGRVTVAAAAAAADETIFHTVLTPRVTGNLSEQLSQSLSITTEQLMTAEE